MRFQFQYGRAHHRRIAICAEPAADGPEGKPDRLARRLIRSVSGMIPRRFPTSVMTAMGYPRAVTGGSPRLDFGNYGFYGIFDQVIWQPDLSAPRALSVFARLMGAPLNDRNFISFSVNGGVTLKAPFQGRDGDIVGLGFGYGLFSSGARGFDADDSGNRARWQRCRRSRPRKPSSRPSYTDQPRPVVAAARRISNTSSIPAAAS